MGRRLMGPNKSTPLVKVQPHARRISASLLICRSLPLWRYKVLGTARRLRHPVRQAPAASTNTTKMTSLQGILLDQDAFALARAQVHFYKSESKNEC